MLSIMNIDHDLIIESKQDNFFPSLKSVHLKIFQYRMQRG